MVSKIWVGMSATNIHLLQFQIQIHLEKHGLEMLVRRNSFRRKKKKKRLNFPTLHSPFCTFISSKVANRDVMNINEVGVANEHK